MESSWFAVALASRVGRQPRRVVLMDRPIVLARIDGRRVVGFEDRCPHRHAPLSRGRVVDGTLQCPYHGWRFDAQGRLRGLPGAPPDACLPGLGARPVDVVEHDGVIWVRYRDGAPDIPVRVRSQDADHRKFIWQTTWQAHIVDALENVLDPLHTHFVHAGLVRRAGVRRPTHVCLSVNREGFTVDYAGQPEQSGLLFRLFESQRESEQAHFCAPGTAQLEYRYRNGSRACISMHFCPLSVDRTQLIGTLHLDGRRVPSWMVGAFLWPFIRQVARQDQRVLAWQAESTRDCPGRKDAITRFDIVRKHLHSVWGGGPHDTGEPPGNRETVLYL